MRRAVVLFGAALFAASARADVSLRPPAGPLRGGSTAWVEVAGLSDDVQEMELFLVPAPGMRPLRLTSSAARTERLEFVVPNIALDGATLRVRTGDGEDEEEETWGLDSSPFAIAVSPLASDSVILDRHGEEWLVSAEGLPSGASASPADERLSAAAHVSPFEAGSGVGTLRPPEAATPLPPARAVPRQPEPRTGPAKGAFSVPLRR